MEEKRKEISLGYFIVTKPKYWFLFTYSVLYFVIGVLFFDYYFKVLDSYWSTWWNHLSFEQYMNQNTHYEDFSPFGYLFIILSLLKLIELIYSIFRDVKENNSKVE